MPATGFRAVDDPRPTRKVAALTSRWHAGVDGRLHVAVPGGALSGLLALTALCLEVLLGRLS